MKFAAPIAMVLLIVAGVVVCDLQNPSDQVSRTSAMSCSSGGFESSTLDFGQLFYEDNYGHRVIHQSEKVQLALLTIVN